MRLSGDGRLPFERSSCGESAFVAQDLEHPSALLLAKVGVDLGVWILSEYVGNLLERLQQSWASWGLRHRCGKANGFGDTGKLAFVATVDASPNMNEFMCQIRSTSTTSSTSGLMNTSMVPSALMDASNA